MKKNILLWGMIATIFIAFLSVIIFMIYHPINTEKEKNTEIDYQNNIHLLLTYFLLLYIV